MSKKCPCGSNSFYSDCCHKIHTNIVNALTPEQLMRSRYTAFTMANINYLMISWHSTTRDNSPASKKELMQWSKSVTWLKLEILNTTVNTVEFKAYFYENGTLECIHENSLFIKENNHWVYLKEYY